MARLAQSAERKALNLVVVGSSPTVGAFCARWALSVDFFPPLPKRTACTRGRAQKIHLARIELATFSV